MGDVRRYTMNQATRSARAIEGGRSVRAIRLMGAIEIIVAWGFLPKQHRIGAAPGHPTTHIVHRKTGRTNNPPDQPCHFIHQKHYRFRATAAVYAWPRFLMVCTSVS